MLWLEPLVEVDTDAGRVGYANVTPDDVAAVLAGEATDIGVVDEHPWLTSQRRVSFARVGVVDPASIADYEAHGGWAGLRRALSLSPAEVVQEVTDSGLRGRGGAGFPAGIKWKTVLGDAVRPEVRGLQLRRGRLRHLRGPDGRRGRPVHADRGHDHRRPRRRGERGLRLRALGVPPRHRRPAARDRRGVHPRLPRPGRPRLRPLLRPARPRRGGRLHLRRGVLDAREPRGPPRRGAGQAADPGHQGPLGPADRGQQRADAVRGADDPGRRRRRRTPSSAPAAPAAPRSSSSPATSSRAASSSCPSG